MHIFAGLFCFIIVVGFVSALYHETTPTGAVAE